MVYEVIVSRKAAKFLEKLDTVTRERIILAMDKLRIRPEAHVKRLVGEKEYRMRVGEYRVIVDIDQNVLRVLVVKIGHRRSIYDR